MADVNKVCRKCRRSCKQIAAVKVVKCELFEPIPEQGELDFDSKDLKSDPRGEGNTEG